jgi:hypothetical protein
MNQSREAHNSAWPLHSPVGGHECDGGQVRLLVQVVADYGRVNAVWGAGRGGQGRASGLKIGSSAASVGPLKLVRAAVGTGRRGPAWPAR